MENQGREKEALQSIRSAIEEAEYVLVGIGEEFRLGQENQEGLTRAYDRLNEMLKGKIYFVVSQLEDEKIFDSGLFEFFIAAPFCQSEREAASEKQWEAYLNWLTATLHHKLCILELGVGFSNPGVIRWPFEKTAQFHQKSTFVRVNQKLPQLPSDLAGRGTSIALNAMQLLADPV